MAPATHHRAGPLTTLAYSLLLICQIAAGTVLLALLATTALLSIIWIGLPLAILITTFIRALADAHRHTLGHFLDEGPIPSPYRALPSTGITAQISAIITDPTTWRDLAWLAFNATIGILIAALPALLLSQALHQTLHATWLWRHTPHYHGLIATPDQATATLLLIPATLLLLLFLTLTPPLLRTYAHLNRWLLAPTEKARLTARVAHLATTRAHTIDTQASEIRRIERDLHDGAQARLVALGMSLGMAEQLLSTDPPAAQKMLTEARETTQQALTELRDLVRGIHPPVLVERGLHGALQALALTHHLPITVHSDLPGRPPDPVESAAYTNTAKHAHATRAWVHINHGQERLVITVGDNGHGGATPTHGTGLAGIRRRLDAFDGTMNTTSPPGGPTLITLEIPCALSSPKTSPSSEKG